MVYGGGAVGIMGEIAQAVLKHGGEVHGIIPEFLVAREHALKTPQGLTVTRDMHERKRKMFEMADAFVALPGGVGTLEEIVEQMTWAQLGRHKKPILLANIEGFWQPLCALLDHMKALEFIRGDLNFDLLVADKVADILPMLQQAAAAVPEEAKKMTDGGRRPALALFDEGHRLDAVAIRIADEGGVIAVAVMRAQSRRAFAGAAGGQRCTHETHRRLRSCARAGTHARRCPAAPASCPCAN